MFTHTLIWYAPVCRDGETYIYEDKKTGLVFTSYGSIPDSNEIEHVEAYHAGALCPIWMEPGKTCCQKYPKEAAPPCYDQGLAGTW